ncbi:hypothetical protein H257_11239 [Aphanomyces astaci]|uniref:Uncharacterized protein n=1 Tax=Aphanomyces astaci TaxID=112090 RepID=W4G4D4_APHAT|nr:hypothetical protein H257_11239 [Aphanomyces astaci]ETV73914.1 hypothetical protein H257_11239 [Aphanomyces astaci]|eukprot:XP_009836427.1 hypothetical protein H257_11239 [Aphanomyces astaci]
MRLCLATRPSYVVLASIGCGDRGMRSHTWDGGSCCCSSVQAARCSSAKSVNEVVVEVDAVIARCRRDAWSASMRSRRELVGGTCVECTGNAAWAGGVVGYRTRVDSPHAVTTDNRRRSKGDVDVCLYDVEVVVELLVRSQWSPASST